MRSTSIYHFLAFIILAAATVYGVLEFRLYAAEKTAVESNAATIQNLSANRAQAQADLSEIAEAQAQTQEKIRKNLLAILPLDENYTDLTRAFDDFFAANDSQTNPILQSSLRYGIGTAVAGIPGISALPISMNLMSSRDNFFKFLEFIERSGSVDSGARLMSVNSINLNFPADGEIIDDPKQVLNWTIDMNAYYKTAKVKR